MGRRYGVTCRQIRVSPGNKCPEHISLVRSVCFLKQMSLAILLTCRVPPFQSRHMHDLAFVCPIARTNQYICILYSPHTINLWNNLPHFVVHSESLVLNI